MSTPGADATGLAIGKERAAGPTGRHRLRNAEIGVRFPGGPLQGVGKLVIRQPWELESVGSIPTPLTLLGPEVQREDASPADW